MQMQLYDYSFLTIFETSIKYFEAILWVWNESYHKFEMSWKYGIFGFNFPTLVPYLGGLGKGEGMPTQA